MCAMKNKIFIDHVNAQCVSLVIFTNYAVQRTIPYI